MEQLQSLHLAVLVFTNSSWLFTAAMFISYLFALLSVSAFLAGQVVYSGFYFGNKVDESDLSEYTSSFQPLL